MRFRAGIVAALVAAMVVPGVSARAETNVTFDGGGWGHGLGMSQYGAYGRARNGHGARKIVKHYYSGTSVGKASVPKRLRVGLLPAPGAALDSISFSSTGTLKIKAGGDLVAKGTGDDSWRAEAAGSGGFRIFKNGSQVRRDGRGVFGGGSTPLILQFHKFRSRLLVSGKAHRYRYGRAEISSYASNSCSTGYCARLVHALPMQKYLYGLGEMPSSWPAAALKAQAIAGRTYALEKVRRLGQKRHPCGCAVYDSTLDQAYIGDSKRDSHFTHWKAAVDSTNEVVVKYEGGPIQALYSSSSGGHTEHNENVWGGGAIPYLRGVPDRPDRARGINPNHSWTVTMSWSELESRFDKASGTGTLQKFEIVGPVGVSGRVTVVKGDGSGGVRITGSAKTVRRSGWDMRSLLGLKDTLFTVDTGVEVGRQFRTKYTKLDGAPGDPTSDVYRVPRSEKPKRGVAQNFAIGRMTKHWELKRVVWQRGPVHKKYNRIGRESSVLRMPRSDVRGTDIQWANYDRGRIYWSEETGAHPMRGMFLKAFFRSGGVEGLLGLPRADRRRRPEWPAGGQRQRFESGTAYRRKGAPVAHYLWGKVDSRYRKIGEAAGPCGYPVADAVEEGDAVTGSFENGSITWLPGVGVEVECS